MCPCKALERWDVYLSIYMLESREEQQSSTVVARRCQNITGFMPKCVSASSMRACRFEKGANRRKAS